MKKYFLLFTFYFSLSHNAQSQNVGIGTNNPLNKLHVAGGFRLDTLVDVGGAGLLRHDANGVVYGIKFSGNINDVLRGDGTFGSGSASTGWSLSGNSGINPASNFIGTTDNASLVFKVNNLPAGRLDSSVFFGVNAGSLSTGKANIGIGRAALHSITDASVLLAIGDSALYNNNTGFGNIALGSHSLFTNSTGYQNTAIGNGALNSNTSGHDNIAIGLGALRMNIDGFENAALGFQTLFSNTSGSLNSAFAHLHCS